MVEMNIRSRNVTVAERNTLLDFIKPKISIIELNDVEYTDIFDLFDFH